jgi:Tfp pilus assembly protein FimT
MPQRRQSSSAAFTLLELVLVMVVICTALAVAAPSMRGWSRGSRLRDAGDQFLALTRLARSQAVAESRVHRLYVDPASGRYWVAAQEGQQFVPIGSSLGQVFVLPEDLVIELTGLEAQSSSMEFIEFHPTGRTWPARVRIALDENDFLEIACESPADEFRLLTASGGRL